MKHKLKNLLFFKPKDKLESYGDSLISIFNSSNLKIIDIGSGNGIGPGIGNFSQLSNYINYFPCDPTINSNSNSNAWKSITHIQEAIWIESGTKLLNITRQPGLSSLLEPNQSVVNTFNNHADYKIKSTETIKTIQLKEAAEKYKFKDAGFLSLDTQGSELEILMSGQSLLETSVSGIYIETEFQELYKGQSLFSDVDAYLRKLGFILFDIDRVLMRRQNYSSKHYSRKQISHCHCLYLKPINLIDDPNKDTMLNKLEQLFVIAVANEHYDLAREICSVEPARYLLFDKHGKSLLDQLEDYIYSRTQTIKHITRKYNPNNELSNPLYKDRKYRYK